MCVTFATVSATERRTLGFTEQTKGLCPGGGIRREDMASVKSKTGANNESSPYRESARASAGSPSLVAGAASLSLTSSRAYSLEDFDTIATVGMSIGFILLLSLLIG